MPPADDIVFDSGTFLLTKAAVEQAKATPEGRTEPEPEPLPDYEPEPSPNPATGGDQPGLPIPQKETLRLRGIVPYENWNSVSLRILSKLRAEEGLTLAVDISVQVDSDKLRDLEADVRQALMDLRLEEQVKIE